MPVYTITLTDPDGGTERVLYDPDTSSLIHEDGRPVDLSPVGFSYGHRDHWPTAPAVSKDNPGRKVSAIRRLKISMGFKCNYACAYCGQASQVGKEEPSSLVDVEAFLTGLGRWWDGGDDGQGQGAFIQFWGGEPFVYWKKMKVLAEGIHARYPNAQLAVTTNGSLLDEAKLEWLEQMGFSVTVSHDGPGQNLRGPDPLEDPEKCNAIRELFIRPGLKEKCSINVVLTRDHHSFKAAREWLIDRLGVPDIQVGSEELLLPYDVGALLTCPATDEEHKAIRLTLFGEIMDGSALGISTVWLKLQDWFNSVAEGRPAYALGQKCGLDRQDTMAVDLKGNVYTCQNTAEDGHRIGHVEDLDRVALTTATHWSLRDECTRCPVVQLCKGACMYLGGEYWRRACDNSFTYNVAMLTGALWMITGKIATAIDGPMRRDGA